MKARPAFWWALPLAFFPLIGWWTYGLFDLDEGFYAAVTAEMNRRGDWITPYYNGQPWFEKPILLYWLAKPSLLLFGNDVGPRLPSVLATFATAALIGWFTNRHFGLRPAVVATLVFSSSLLVVGIGRMMLTDPLLLLCLTGAILTFWESLVGNPRWRLVSAFALGAGVLTKGPVGCVFFVLLAGITYWREPELRPKFRGWWGLGTLIFALTVASWYEPAYLVNGHVFVQQFLIEQNIGRFTGGDQAHTVRGIAGLVFYPLVILVGFIPWSFWLPTAWRKIGGSEEAPLKRYLTVWFLIVLVFFTISGAKLPSYILPIAPALAILVASVTRRDNVFLVVAIGWLAAVYFVAQVGFRIYYYGGVHIGALDVPGSQAEVHRLARYVHDHAVPGDQVAEFQMSRQTKSLGTGKPVLQETSQPSTLLYLNRDVLDTDDWSAVIAQRTKTWILTRSNRVSPEDLREARGHISLVGDAPRQDYYRLYLYTPGRPRTGSPRTGP